MGSYRQWIELYNASDEPVALAGLRLTFVRLSDDKRVAFPVRDQALEVAPGGYVVLGGGDPEDAPYIDYDYSPDYHSMSEDPQVSDLFGAAVLTLSACGQIVDEVEYQALPAAGTLALDGASPPESAANDGSERWCIDAREGPTTGIRRPGSPGEKHPPCP